MSDFPIKQSLEGPVDNDDDDENESVSLARSADFIFKRTQIRISKQTSLDVTTSNISSLFQVPTFRRANMTNITVSVTDSMILSQF